MFLGLDLSTQQLKAVVLDNNLQIQHETNVHFDNDLPEFRTSGGVIRHQNNPKVIRAPVLMWVKALDLILEKLQSRNINFSKIVAISGCAQQHGTVYWSKGSQSKLSKLNSSKFLHEELFDCFSLSNSPTWMDSSTRKECDILENTAGGAMKLAEITGSRAYERFSGPQIAKIAREEKYIYVNTERISLVSSFLASLFIGDYAPIDWSDGSGMNLLNIHTKTWDNNLLEACAPGLENKLGNPIPASTIIGSISKYFVDKYNFDDKCKIIAFTGDNPSSLVGVGVKKEDIICSLGTSDTLFLWLDKAKTIEHGHVLCNPLDEDSYMVLHGNGSLTRERIQKNFANNSWKLFNELLKNTPPGNYGNLAMYLDVQEVMPPLTGDYRFNEKNEEVEKFNSNDVDIRALIEGQFIIRRIFTEDFGILIGPETRIVATGGASVNKDILQILTDVFNSPVYVSNNPNTAAVGAAYRAKLSFAGSNKDVIQQELILTCKPHRNAESIYKPMINRCRLIIQELLQKKSAK